MKRTAVRRTAATVLAALLMSVGTAVSVAPAHADSDTDETFLAYLDKKGIPYHNTTQIIRVAKQYCLDTTRPNQAWLAGYRLTKDNGWTETQATLFINGAVPAYCPQLWQ